MEFLSASDKLLGWPARYHDPVIERITRALYFYEFKRVLQSTAKITVYWCRTIDDIYNYTRRLNPEMQQLWHELPGKRASGQHAFRYSLGHALENPLYTIWMFDFYGAHFAAAYTAPAEDPALMDAVDGDSV